MTKNKKDSTTLGYLGADDQRRIVKALIEDNKFLMDVETSLNPNVFTESPKLRQIVDTVKTYHKDKKLFATYKDLELILKEKAKDDLDLQESIDYIKELQDNKYFIGINTAKEIATNFFKQQQTLKVLNKALEDVGNNGYTDKTIPNLQENLKDINKNVSTNMGTNLLDIFDRMMDRDMEQKVPTCIPELDTQMKYGLPKGMVGLLIAGTGAGKTSLSTILCGNAAYNDYKVLQIYFEETQEEMAAKHYAHFSRLYTSVFNSTTDKIAVWNGLKQDPKLMKAFKENIRLVRMENGATQVEDIRNLIDKLISTEGFKPDMVFIDYFSCLQKSSNKMVEYDNECKAGEKAMKKLEQLAQDYNIALWVAEQTNRNGVKLATANDRIANVQGSFRITQPASFILYLDRTGYSGQEDMCKANLYLDKCRGCQPKAWEGIYLNNGNLQIDMSETVQINDSKAYVPGQESGFTYNNINN